MYLLTQQILNGTVTMQIISTGIEAKTFEEAIKKIKNLPNFKEAIINCELKDLFSYTIFGKFPCVGTMKNESLIII